MVCAFERSQAQALARLIPNSWQSGAGPIGCPRMKPFSHMVDFEGMMIMKGEGAAAATRSGLAPWKWPLVAASLLAILYIFLFHDWLNSQLIRAIDQQADWGHTLVVPLIAGYLVYLNRAKLLAERFRTAWSGLIPMVLGVGIYVLSTVGPMLFRHYNIEAFGVWLTLAGMVLLFCGWRAMKWLWFPLLYLLVFGQTISERLLQIVTFPMQDITARGAHFLLSLGLDVERKGNTIFIYYNGQEKPLNIAQACSGMRMLMAFLALGVVMAYTGLKHYWQRVALVVLAVPTAIFVNVLRVITLGLLSLADAEFAGGEFHKFIGLVWLVPAFLIYLGLMWVIKRLVVEEPPAAARAA
jgi:exosortase